MLAMTDTSTGRKRGALSLVLMTAAAALTIPETSLAEQLERPTPRIFRPSEAPKPRTSDHSTGSLAPVRPTARRQLTLVPFKHAPFPYDGTVPPEGTPFFDLTANGTRGRTTTRTGAVYWEHETYSDNRVLIHFAKGFAASRPALIVLFLHGNRSTIERDVARRQALMAQVDASGANAVLLAPQLAVDALDSSAGQFWQPGALARFLDEAATHLARLHPAGKRGASQATYRRLPVVIVAYSGGYQPAAWLLHHGGAEERIAGVAILDGLYGQQDKFAGWLQRRPEAFFVTAYGTSSAEGNAELRRLISAPIAEVNALPTKLDPGTIAFVAAPPDVQHHDFVTRAWTQHPVADLLARIPNYRRAVRR
jgi:hypothetical protein